MARLYDPTEGRVTFAGIDLRDAQLRSLRARITVVPQEGYLFAGTIRDNVRIGRPEASDAEVERASSRSGSSSGSRPTPRAWAPRCTSADPACRRASAS